MHIIILIVLMQTLLLTGCLDRGNKNAENFIKVVKQEKSDKIPPLPEIQQYKTVDYTVATLRDPFKLSSDFAMILEGDKNNKITAVVKQSRPDAGRTRELLENYSLNSIRMVGSIRKGTTFWGIVKDKTGIIHKVHVGNYLGENSGCINRITANTIFIKEILADGQGGWTERESSLNLAE